MQKRKCCLGCSDVGISVAQEPIFFYYGQVLIGGPFEAYWALGESLGPDTFVRNIFLERPDKA